MAQIVVNTIIQQWKGKYEEIWKLNILYSSISFHEHESRLHTQ
jgi:hypothetical protein